MITFIKAFIDRTTMYRLVLYVLLVLLGAGLVLSIFNLIWFTPGALLWSAAVLMIASWAANELCARISRAVTNHESVYITSVILALILGPVSITDVRGTLILAAVAALAIVSKYLLTWRHKHLFNPAALGAVVSMYLFGVPAAWWVEGNMLLLPLIVVGGLMIVHKLRKGDLVLSFIICTLLFVGVASPLNSLLLFFAFVMLTEPLTMPPTRKHRIIYGALVAGLLFIPGLHIGSLYFTPELALLAGNLYSFLVSPKGRFTLTLVERRTVASGIYEYLFKSDRRISFTSGQYLEWTARVAPPDMRGNRRFFTIASAPEDEFIALGTRISEAPSAFKRALSQMPIGGVVSVSSLAGDFILPKDTKRKLAFIAGGIGVTPFASMARHCIKGGESRDAVLLYGCKAENEIAYRDVFSQAEQVGWRTVYALAAMDPAFIKAQVPDYAERLFYVSGPPGMVDAMKRNLIGLGISRFNIKTDFFAGLA